MRPIPGVQRLGQLSTVLQITLSAALITAGVLILLGRDYLSRSTGAPPSLVNILMTLLALEGVSLFLLGYRRDAAGLQTAGSQSIGATEAGGQGAGAPQDGRVQEIYRTTSIRLRQEIESLVRRGNWNLLIGMLTSISAVAVLAYITWGVEVSFSSFNALLGYYIPRIMTAIFIEVFSFFFLRQYRASLSEVKYYQGQLTELAQQEIAIEVTRGEAYLTPLIADRLLKDGRNASAEATDRASQASGVGVKEVTALLEKLIEKLPLK